MEKKEFLEFKNDLEKKGITLVAVSKTKSIEEIYRFYGYGQRDFGENYVQELVEKQAQLPKDIRWHFIGHLQTNKVKLIAPFVSLIQSVDSDKLLNEINKQAKRNERTIDCLLEMHIAKEDTKFGLVEAEANTLINQYIKERKEGKNYKNVVIKGLMGMASFTEDQKIQRKEFRYLKSSLDKYNQLLISDFQFSILSMGMSADYKIAVEEGSNLVRIGSLIFGERKTP